MAGAYGFADASTLARYASTVKVTGIGVELAALAANLVDCQVKTLRGIVKPQQSRRKHERDSTIWRLSSHRSSCSDGSARGRIRVPPWRQASDDKSVARRKRDGPWTASFCIAQRGVQTRCCRRPDRPSRASMGISSSSEGSCFCWLTSGPHLPSTSQAKRHRSQAAIVCSAADSAIGTKRKA